MFIVGIGSGMFNSPNTAAMMGTVAPHRRGIAAGARVLVQNTGAVISIAFVLAIVTSAVPKHVLFKVFSGLAQSHLDRPADAVHLQHAHRAVVPDRGLARRRGGLGRPAEGGQDGNRRRAAGGGRMSRYAPANRSGARERYRRADAADRRARRADRAPRRGRSATTRRSACSAAAPSARRASTAATREADVERVREIVRLRDLLGLSLEQLSQLLEAESARADLRREYQETESPDERRRILEQLAAVTSGPSSTWSADASRS